MPLKNILDVDIIWLLSYHREDLDIYNYLTKTFIITKWSTPLILYWFDNVIKRKGNKWFIITLIILAITVERNKNQYKFGDIYGRLKWKNQRLFNGVYDRMKWNKINWHLIILIKHTIKQNYMVFHNTEVKREMIQEWIMEHKIIFGMGLLFLTQTVCNLLWVESGKSIFCIEIELYAHLCHMLFIFCPIDAIDCCRFYISVEMTEMVK